MRRWPSNSSSGVLWWAGHSDYILTNHCDQSSDPVSYGSRWLSYIIFMWPYAQYESIYFKWYGNGKALIFSFTKYIYAHFAQQDTNLEVIASVWSVHAFIWFKIKFGQSETYDAVVDWQKGGAGDQEPSCPKSSQCDSIQRGEWPYWSWFMSAFIIPTTLAQAW